MNEWILREQSVVRESLGAADGGLAKPRSLDELRDRIHVLFRHVDQAVVQHAGVHADSPGASDRLLDRFWRGQAVEWVQ
jgi:hypothetical protein